MKKVAVILSPISPLFELSIENNEQHGFPDFKRGDWIKKNLIIGERTLSNINVCQISNFYKFIIKI